MDDVNVDESSSGSDIYRIRWSSAIGEDLRCFCRNPLDTTDYSLWCLVAVEC